MLTEEDIKHWNEIFPHNKMKWGDLENPSKTFLTNVLISYLQMFGYDVVQPTQQNESAENHRFLIKLTYNVDHILKRIDKSYAFTYYDLINPTPKKTKKILSILLNYLYYFNLYRTEVFSKTTDYIKRRNELTEEIKLTTRENEERKMQAENMAKNIEEYTMELTELSAKLKVLQREAKDRKKGTKALEEELHRLQELHKEIEATKRALKKKIVSNNEVLELRSQIAKLKGKIEELSVEEDSKKTAVNEQRNEVKSLEDMCKNITEMLPSMPLRQAHKHKELSKKKQKAQNYLLSLRDQQQEMIAIQKSLENDKKFYEETFEKQVAKSTLDANETKARIEEKANLHSATLLEKEKMASELTVTNNMFAEQHDIEEYITTNIVEILAQYKI